MVSEPKAPARRGYPIVVTIDGLTYGFDTPEERNAFLKEYEQTHREQRIEQGRKAMEMVHALRAQILERTGGKGIPIEEIDRAWREAKGG
jgi:hypothetical protein